MDGETIKRVLQKHPLTAPFYEGIYSADEIPWHKTNRSKRSFFIFNLDPSYEEGSHWICIMLDPTKRAFYFDSYGFGPNNPAFEKFMNNCYEFNDRGLQHPGSTNCGQWCLYFIYHMALDGDFKNLLKQFPRSKGRLYNDYLLSSKVRKIFNLDVWPLDQEFLLSQLARN
jgi:hypothetical protein